MLSRTLWVSPWFPLLLITPFAAQRSTPVERQVVAAGVWAEARYHYAHWDAVRANWDSGLAAIVAYAAERPPPTDVQFFRRVRRWGALLNDGQFEILPPGTIASRIARPPLALRSVERRPFIIDYATNDEMRVARPERLAEILAVQGIPSATWIRDSVLPEVPGGTEQSRWERAVAKMLEGERGTALHLSLRLPGGGERGASVTRSVSLTARWPLDGPALEADTLPDGVIWIRVNSFADPAVPALLERALGDAAREGPRHRGVIVDLRETTWTTAGRVNAYDALARLIDRPLLTAGRRTPQHRATGTGSDWITAPPDTIWPVSRREGLAYTGPVVALASARTAGAAEDFLVAFRAGRRGPVIGVASAGATGETATLPLAGGWQLRLTVTHDALPDGKEFVRTGIPPDFAVEARVEDFLAGSDSALERARAYLAELARR